MLHFIFAFVFKRSGSTDQIYLIFKKNSGSIMIKGESKYHESNDDLCNSNVATFLQ